MTPHQHASPWAATRDTALGRIEPQPPQGIKYMLGAESWLAPAAQSPLRLVCEEWGNLGPAELNAEIKDNGHGFRVRVTEFLAPAGADNLVQIDGVYYWTAATDPLIAGGNS